MAFSMFLNHDSFMMFPTTAIATTATTASLSLQAILPSPKACDESVSHGLEGFLKEAPEKFMVKDMVSGKSLLLFGKMIEKSVVSGADFPLNQSIE